MAADNDNWAQKISRKNAQATVRANKEAQQKVEAANAAVAASAAAQEKANKLASKGLAKGTGKSTTANPNGKGKGKGKGKNNDGKGKGKAAGTWICDRPECLEVLKIKHPWRTSYYTNSAKDVKCQICWHAPDDGAAAAKAKALQEADDDYKAKLAVLRQTASPAHDGVGQQAALQHEAAAKDLRAGGQARAKGQELAFTNERVLADFKILRPVLTQLTESLKAELLPTPLVARDAQETFDFYIGEARKLDPKGPGARAETIQKLEAEIQKIQSALVIFEKGDEETTAPLQKKLDKLKEELEKQMKNPPTQSSQHAGLVQAMSLFETKMQERTGRRQQGKEKTAERSSERKAYFSEMRAALQAAEEETARLETWHNDQHAERTVALAQQEQETRDLFQKVRQERHVKADQEAAARTAAPQPPPAVTTAVTFPYVGQGTTADAVAAAQADAAKTRVLFAELEKKSRDDREILELRLLEIKKQSQQIDEMRRLLAEKDAAAVAAATAAAVQHTAMNTSNDPTAAATCTEEEYELHVAALDRDSPVKPTMPKGDLLIQASQVHAWLDAWNLGGQKIMFTFRQLDDAAKLGGHAAEFCAHFLGDENFAMWFPSSPPLTKIVPRQVALILFFTLDILRKELTKQKETRAEAAASFEILITNENEKWATSAAKKLRASTATASGTSS